MKKFPLSFAQQRLWFLNQLEPDSTAYNIARAIRMSGCLDIARFEKSIDEIVKRHDSLRTTFENINNQPYQVIAPFYAENLQVSDISNVSGHWEDMAYNIMTDEINFRFDLSKGPLFRTKLIRLSENEHIFMLTMHHIISDGWSMRIFFKELADLYNTGGKHLPGIAYQYADYTLFQNEWLKSEAYHDQLLFWQKKLSRLTYLSLPADKIRPPVLTHNGKMISKKLSCDLSNEIYNICRTERSPLFAFLVASFNVLLYRLSGSDDICTGTPMANRNSEQVEKLIGMFLNTLVLRSDLSGNPSFIKLLEKTRRELFEAYDNIDIPFEKLVSEINVERNLKYTPFFSIVINLLNYPRGFDLNNIHVEEVFIENSKTNYELIVYIEETNNGLNLIAQYNTDIFSEIRINTLLSNYETLLENIVINPCTAISEIPILKDKEKYQVLFDGNNTCVHYPADTVCQLFEKEVCKNPDAIAIVSDNTFLTYRQLYQQVNQFARYLISRNVTQASIIGVYMERSVDLVIGILGILRAGAAYLPLDTRLPRERLRYMVDDAKAAFVITQSHVKANIPGEDIQWIDMDEEREVIGGFAVDHVEVPVNVDGLAYIIYTSGSTGVPKGVMIEHSAMMNYVHWATGTYIKEGKGTFPLYTSVSFDLTVTSIFIPLITGHKIVIYREEEGNILIERVVQDNQVDIIKLTPSHLKIIRDSEISKNIPGSSIKTFIVGGEELETQLAGDIYNKFGGDIDIYNEYGPTEATVGCMIYKFNPHDISTSVPIGIPIHNTQIYILDKLLNPVPVGVVGEIYISGAGLAKGYLQKEELTAQRFIPNPFLGGQRMYRTGDLACRLPDGHIQYLGRSDNQIKMLGFRIELSEIEYHLKQYPGISESCVVFHKDPMENQRLTAYVVRKSGADTAIQEIRGFLAKKLPHYMIPTAYVFLDSMPLTLNGKIDKQSLPLPGTDNFQVACNKIPPKGRTQQVIAKVWQDILEIPQISMDDNFFDIGGHSLLIPKMVSRLSREFEKTIVSMDIFKYPSIRLLASFIDGSAGEKVTDLHHSRMEFRKEISVQNRKNRRLRLAQGNTGGA